MISVSQIWSQYKVLRLYLRQILADVETIRDSYPCSIETIGECLLCYKYGLYFDEQWQSMCYDRRDSTIYTFQVKVRCLFHLRITSPCQIFILFILTIPSFLSRSRLSASVFKEQPSYATPAEGWTTANIVNSSLKSQIKRTLKGA